VRRYLAIFFSALLVVVQALPGISLAIPASPADSLCKCCNCGGAGCCVTESAPTPQPLQALPAAPIPQLTQLLFLCLSSSDSATLLTRLPEVRHSVESAFRPRAVPIFQRDCAFLI